MLRLGSALEKLAYFSLPTGSVKGGTRLAACMYSATFT
jgi:hypothetical protein